MARALIERDFETGKTRRLATFDLVKGKVKAKWESRAALIQRSIERHGIVYKGIVYMMDDGSGFYEALMHAFATSSTVFVEDL